MLGAENAENFLSSNSLHILPSDTPSSPKAVCDCMSPEDSTKMCMVKAQNRATTGILVWHLWFEESVQWLESCTFRPKKCDTRLAMRELSLRHYNLPTCTTLPQNLRNKWSAVTFPACSLSYLPKASTASNTALWHCRSSKISALYPLSMGTHGA